MKLDWTLNVGDVLVALGLLVGFFGAHVQNVRRLQKIETRLGMIYSWFLRRVIGGEGGKNEEEY